MEGVELDGVAPLWETGNDHWKGDADPFSFYLR